MKRPVGFVPTYAGQRGHRRHQHKRHPHRHHRHKKHHHHHGGTAWHQRSKSTECFKIFCKTVAEVREETLNGINYSGRVYTFFFLKKKERNQTFLVIFPGFQVAFSHFLKVRKLGGFFAQLVTESTSNLSSVTLQCSTPSPRSRT